MEFDDDTHLCLRCSKTIFGLENYVIHRQEHCLGVQLPCNSKEDHETSHSPPLSSSPPQNSPWDVPLTANDFFSCLELQSTITPTPVKQQASPSIFSNESNPAPSFPEGVSGTELEFLSPPESISCSSLISTHTPSKEMDKSEVDYLPPHSHTGGKWKPGSRLHLINRQQCAIHPAYSFLEQNVLTISDNLSHSVNLETTASAEVIDVVDAYFKCPHCGHDFSCETQMNSHISSSHKDVANNRDIHTKSKCPYTSFSTSKKSCFSLKSSEFTLKPSSCSLSPFKCTSCNKLFRETFNFCCHLFSQKHRSKFEEYQNWLSEIFQYENIIIHSMPFQCLLCFFYVSDFILFMKHVKSSEHIKNIAGTNNPMYCFTCSFECPSEEEMVSHLYSTHEKTLLSAHPVMILEKGYTFFCTFCNGTCKFCIATFSNDGLIVKTGKNDTLDEVICKKKNYRQHEARKRTCVFCKISFSSSKALKYHRMKCSKALSASSNLNQFSRKKNVNRNAIKSLIRLKKQSKISDGKLLKMCSKNNTESCIPDILCHSLYKNIPDGENVYTPMEQHSQGEIYKCSKCVFHTTTEISLLNHEEGMHEVIQPAADNICGSPELNKQHVSEFKEIHSLAELKCEYNDCQHLCHSLSELTQHMKLHSKLRPYQCGMCDYCGKTVHQLKKHQRTHTGEKPFKCKLCTYSASRSHQLLRHMRLHTGSKPYKCPYCDYTCNNQENIRKHILKTKKHEGKKMYPCTYCDFACNESQSYQKHLLGNHKEYFPMGIKDIDSSVVAGLYVRDFPRKIVASMVVS